jgi:uncharacterized protein YbaP (TraB family)
MGPVKETERTNGVTIWTRLRQAARRLLKTAAAAAMAASVAQAQPQPQAQPAPQARPVPARPASVTRIARPALWRLRDRDTTIYLFGTIHALPEGLHWHGRTLDRAFDSAGEVVMEVAPAELGAGAARAMRQLGLDPDAPPILERVPADRRAALAALIQRSGLPASLFDRMKTWAAAITLTAINFQHMGLAGERGIETNLASAAGDRPTTGLETAEQQLGYLDSLSEESQRALLVSTTDDEAAGRAEFERMLDAWSRGDVAGIAASFNTDETMTPELRRVLLTGRNARWTDWIERRLARPGTVFIAVGAGHLAGEGSVIADLAARGLRAERVQ